MALLALIACTPFSEEQLDDWFTYHPPTAEQATAYEAIAQNFGDAWAEVEAAMTQRATELAVLMAEVEVVKKRAAGLDAIVADPHGQHTDQTRAQAKVDRKALEPELLGRGRQVTPYFASQRVFQGLTGVFRAFAVAIGEHCPNGADKAAAIRSLRLARNCANDALCGKRMTESLAWARFHLTAARHQANASIACRWMPARASTFNGPDPLADLKALVEATHGQARASHEHLADLYGKVLVRTAALADVLELHSDRLMVLDARLMEYDRKVSKLSPDAPLQTGGPGPEAADALIRGSADPEPEPDQPTKPAKRRGKAS
jgi:hypothetical protein